MAGILIKINEEMGIAGGTVGTTLGAVDLQLLYIIYIYSKRETTKKKHILAILVKRDIVKRR